MTLTRDNLAGLVAEAFAKPAAALGKAERELWAFVVTLLREGKVRAAEPRDGGWFVNTWVKQAILVGMRAGVMIEIPSALPTQPFIDKDTMLPRPVSLHDKIRLVPGGVSIRDGAYVAPGVVLIPPAYINVGAYVGEGTLIDSNALVGSCAQVGKNVHVSAAAQIGGVLEPAGAMPVVIEDDALIGGNCGVYEGTWVRKRAVLGAGVILTASTKVYDLVNECVYQATEQVPLTIPEGAVVVPGSRPARGAYAQQHGLSVATPLIIKYRDEKTDARSALEAALRPT